MSNDVKTTRQHTATCHTYYRTGFTACCAGYEFAAVVQNWSCTRYTTAARACWRAKTRKGLVHWMDRMRVKCRDWTDWSHESDMLGRGMYVWSYLARSYLVVWGTVLLRAGSSIKLSTSDGWLKPNFASCVIRYFRHAHWAAFSYFYQYFQGSSCPRALLLVYTAYGVLLFIYTKYIIYICMWTVKIRRWLVVSNTSTINNKNKSSANSNRSQGYIIYTSEYMNSSTPYPV